MKVSLLITLIFLFSITNAKKRCYSCSDKVNKGCTERAPLKTTLPTVECENKCYKWVMHGPNKEVTRGCYGGAYTSADSFCSYECNSDLCNRGVNLHTSYAVAALLLTYYLL